jgi:TRAP-type mannitol/chloroaromatic compound transport system permease small subunit
VAFQQEVLFVITLIEELKSEIGLKSGTLIVWVVILGCQGAVRRVDAFQT